MGGLAYFVSPHGYGHAARACAVMHSVAMVGPDTRMDVITTVPRWFFTDSLQREVAYHRLEVDVGMVQRTSMEEDPHTTVLRVQKLLDPRGEALERAVDRLEKLGCDAVICDISPIGLLAAQRLGLPSILVENFTWDFIYQAYQASCEPLSELAERMAEIYGGATVRVQTNPHCVEVENAHTVGPVSRCGRNRRQEVRRELGVSPDDTLVLLTMGGITFEYGSLERLVEHRSAHFVVPGSAEVDTRSGHLISLPHHSEYYHPDLVAAADLVVGKVGYSTLAEVYHRSAVFAFVPRPMFPESPVLAAFAEREMAAVNLVAEGLDRWRWLDHIDELVARRRPQKPRPNGADEVAKIILDTLARTA